MSLIRKLSEHTLKSHSANAATVLHRLDESDSLDLLNRAAPDSVVAIVRRLSPHYAARILRGLKPELAKRFLEEVSIDVATRLLRRLDAPAQADLLDRLDPKRARSIRSVLQFRPGSAGALMDPDVLALPQELTAREALQRIRKHPELARYNIYVVDQDARLVGVLNLREVLLARGRSLLADIMTTKPYSVVATADRTTLISHPGWKEVHSLPVIDDDSAYLGAIRYRTLRELEEELLATEQQDADSGAAFGQLISAAAGGVLDALGGATHLPEGRK